MILDDILNGACCAICDCYFIDESENYVEHGHMTACSNCWFEGCKYPKSKYNVFK